jgi:hypothetical protein
MSSDHHLGVLNPLSKSQPPSHEPIETYADPRATVGRKTIPVSQPEVVDLTGDTSEDSSSEDPDFAGEMGDVAEADARALTDAEEDAQSEDVDDGHGELASNLDEEHHEPRFQPVYMSTDDIQEVIDDDEGEAVSSSSSTDSAPQLMRTRLDDQDEDDEEDEVEGVDGTIDYSILNDTFEIQRIRQRDQHSRDSHPPTSSSKGKGRAPDEGPGVAALHGLVARAQAFPDVAASALLSRIGDADADTEKEYEEAEENEEDGDGDGDSESGDEHEFRPSTLGRESPEWGMAYEEDWDGEVEDQEGDEEADEDELEEEEDEQDLVLFRHRVSQEFVSLSSDDESSAEDEGDAGPSQLEHTSFRSPSISRSEDGIVSRDNNGKDGFEAEDPLSSWDNEITSELPDIRILQNEVLLSTLEGGLLSHPLPDESSSAISQATHHEAHSVLSASPVPDVQYPLLSQVNHVSGNPFDLGGRNLSASDENKVDVLESQNFFSEGVAADDATASMEPHASAKEEEVYVTNVNTNTTQPEEFGDPEELRDRILLEEIANSGFVPPFELLEVAILITPNSFGVL